MPKTLKIKELFSIISELKNRAAKEKLAKEYHKKFNKLVKSKNAWGKKKFKGLRLHNDIKVDEILRKRLHREITRKIWTRDTGKEIEQ